MERQARYYDCLLPQTISKLQPERVRSKSSLVSGYGLTFLRRIDPSDYSHRTEIDPPLPFAYEVKCLHADIDTLERMIHPRLDPHSEEYYSLRMESGHPFTEVEFIELDHVVTGLTLFEFNRSSFFGFVQSEGKIVLVDPSTRQIFIMTCADHPDHIGQVCRNFSPKLRERLMGAFTSGII